MAVVHNTRSLTLYARPHGPQGHRIRLILAEKGVAGYHLIEVNDGNEDLAAVNPYNTLPTLVDRDLVLYDPRAIIEYLDERYPHPPLMPVDPVHRARYRMAVYRFEVDLYAPSEAMDCAAATVRKARTSMQDALTRLAGELPSRGTLGEEYSLLDCTLAPILWRLGFYRLRLPARQQHLLRTYADKLFQRQAFTDSLSALEQEMPQSLGGC